MSKSKPRPKPDVRYVPTTTWSRRRKHLSPMTTERGVGGRLKLKTACRGTEAFDQDGLVSALKRWHVTAPWIKDLPPCRSCFRIFARSASLFTGDAREIAERLYTHMTGRKIADGAI